MSHSTYRNKHAIIKVARYNQACYNKHAIIKLYYCMWETLAHTGDHLAQQKLRPYHFKPFHSLEKGHLQPQWILGLALGPQILPGHRMGACPSARAKTAQEGVAGWWDNPISPAQALVGSRRPAKPARANISVLRRETCFRWSRFPSCLCVTVLLKLSELILYQTAPFGIFFFFFPLGIWLLLRGFIVHVSRSWEAVLLPQLSGGKRGCRFSEGFR